MKQTEQTISEPLKLQDRSYTPGPWKWSAHALWGSDYGLTHGDKTCLECDHEPYECGPSILGVVCEEFLDNAEEWACSEADRTLIEAAPELLEILEKLIACHNDPTCQVVNVAQDLVRRIRGV